MIDLQWQLKERFDFEGQSVAYDMLGAGEPLVMVHGTPFSSYVWRSIARELSQHYKVYLYDLLGYGASEKRSGQNVSLGVQNRVFAALLQHWGLDRPNIIAHDFGGATVLRAHLIDGCDYRKLLMFDVVAIRPWGSPFVQHVKNHEEAFAGVPDYLQRAILRAYIQSAIHRRMNEAELDPFIGPWLGEAGQPAFYRQIAQMDLKYTDEVESKYGQIRCPVSLLWGANDKWIPVERGRQLAKLIPDCPLSEVPGAGHLMQEDAPEAIVAAAMAFFD